MSRRTSTGAPGAYKWTTLQALADFKPRHLTKIELWLLFPEPMFVRFLRTDGGEVDQNHARSVTDMYGTDRWWEIYEARLRHHNPRQARAEYVNLMRWRLEERLGYEWTHTLEVHNERDMPIYHLIFATDHEAGNRIMAHLYNRAVKEFPRMRQHAIDQRTGAARLFMTSMTAVFGMSMSHLGSRSRAGCHPACPRGVGVPSPDNRVGRGVSVLSYRAGMVCLGIMPEGGP